MPTLGRWVDDLDLDLRAGDLDPWLAEVGDDPAGVALLSVGRAVNADDRDPSMALFNVSSRAR